MEIDVSATAVGAPFGDVNGQAVGSSVRPDMDTTCSQAIQNPGGTVLQPEVVDQYEHGCEQYRQLYPAPRDISLAPGNNA